MSKIAIVGCQSSGKTVFMASLSDYFRAGQRPDQTCWLIPENSDAHKFTERRNYEMRILHMWPDATLGNPMSLKWSLRQKNGVQTDIEMLEFSGEVFRAAFREEGSSPQHKEAAESLVSYLIDADFVVVLVGMNELFRSHNEDRKILEDDIESTWVTRGLIDFVKKNLPPSTGLIVGLTQADLYKNELEKFGGAANVLKARWPMISALYPDIPVVAVASVSKTTADGRPAEGYTTEGVLPVMKAYSEFVYGSPADLIAEMESLAGVIQDVGKAGPIASLEQKLARHRQALDELSAKVTIVDALYDDVIKKHSDINSEASAFVESIRAILAKNVEERQDSKTWDELRARFPSVTGTITAYEADSREQHEKLLADRARKDEAERKAREEEARRMEESAKRDEERRRQLELAERERRAEAEKVRIEQTKAKVEARFFVIRAAAVLVVLCGAAWGVRCYYDNKRNAEIEVRNRIESENAVKLAEVRKAEALSKELAEKNRETELSRKKLEEENKKRELELRRQEAERKAAAEKQRLVDEENARKRIELERKKVEEERALEEEKRKRLEEENRKRQIEVEREAALRKAEEERQHKLAEEVERKRKEEERIAAEKKEAENAAKKLAADRLAAAAALKRLGEAINRCSVSRSKDLVAELTAKEDLLKAEDKKLLDEAVMCAEVLEKADAGDEDAQMKLAEMFYKGNAVVGKDHACAYRWYLRLADAGDPIAQCKVGEMLMMGDGVAENVITAHQYFLRAAEQNNPRAQFVAAEMYRIGKGVDKDQKLANVWYEKAAELGDADAQMAWSKRLQNGDGMFLRDSEKAFEWLLKAANSGNAEACYQIGCQYYSGKGNLKFSLPKAYKMLLKAKENGYASKDLDRRIKICEQMIIDQSSK